MRNTKAGLKPYTKYRDSEIPELGQIPEHWDLMRLRQLGTFSKGSGGTKQDEVDQGLPCIRYGDLYTFHKYFITETRSFITHQKANDYTPIRNGDILFTTSDVTIRNVGKSAVNLLDPPVYCGPDLIILRPTGRIHARFAGYLLDSPYAQNQKARMQRGVTIMHIYTNQLGDIPVALPTVDEQAAIVQYLDDAEQRIRAYVIAKEKLIALLEEESQAIIHQAVTRGLDPNVKLKTSGVEWLGDVPGHWQILRLDSLATKFGSGITPRGGASVYQETGIPFLRSQNIHFDGLRLTGVARISPSLHQELTNSHVKPGDVLLNITGASIGRVSTVPPEFEDGNVNQHVCIIRPKQDLLLSKLLSAYLSTPMMQQAIQSAQSGASREGLTLQSIRDFKVAIPPIIEQQAIVKHFEIMTAKIYAAIDRARRQIELMEEYRTRLIADAVTGQIDVRGARP